MSATPRIESELLQVGPRLRQAREKKSITLAELSVSTGISKSTLSRLESGQRKPSLELLLPITAALAVAFDEIVSPPRVIDPRVQQRATRTDGRVLVPLSKHQGEPQAFKITIPGKDRVPIRNGKVHAGYEWLFVLSGQLRLILGEHDVVLGPGEAAEFDTLNPHWFGSADGQAVEILSMFGKKGERMHLRTRAKSKSSGV
ncbi:Cro/C1-type helix-turn-helix domain [Candidatus Nanopelagicaceae bacterium]